VLSQCALLFQMGSEFIRPSVCMALPGNTACTARPAIQSAAHTCFFTRAHAIVLQQTLIDVLLQELNHMLTKAPVATGNVPLEQDPNGDGCYLADARPNNSPNTLAEDDNALIACFNGQCTLTENIPESEKPLPPPEETAPPPLVEPPEVDDPTPAQSRSIVDGCSGLYQPCCPGAPLALALALLPAVLVAKRVAKLCTCHACVHMSCAARSHKWSAPAATRSRLPDQFTCIRTQSAGVRAAPRLRPAAAPPRPISLRPCRQRR
jgi:hypothetical protein